MKNLKLLLTLFLLTIITGAGIAQDSSTPLKNYLSGIPGLQIETLVCADPFTEKYLVYLPQPIDHQHPEKGSFTQRVYILHRDKDAPMVLTTEGYHGGYAGYEWYRNELDNYLAANEVVVEHRYFGPSSPDSLDWQYMTVEQAATDHHMVVELLKPFYTGKWVNTGISKGGQTALYHRAYFPDDVDATVGYVCPLNFSIEERRCYEFLDQVGSDECRQKIHDFQELLLCNKDKYFPVFKKIIDEAGLHFTRASGDTAGYELTVLEYSFAYWQWGKTSCDSIPQGDVDPIKAILHLQDVAGLDWVSDEGIGSLQPFFYQSLTEIGFYGYDLSEFEGCVTALDKQSFDFTCPEGATCIYDPAPMEKVDYFVRHRGDNMIFIYGEWDPWSAPGVQITGKTNSFKVVKPEGSHGTRIHNLPEAQKQIVLESLGEWLDCEIYW